MRLITLNTWGARIYEPLMQFLRDQAPTTDIFCLQEVFHTTSDRIHTGEPPHPRVDMLDRIVEVLGNEFAHYYSVAHEGYDEVGKVDFHLAYGIAIFVRRDTPVMNYEEVFVVGEGNVEQFPGEDWIKPRAVQVLELDSQVIINFHGLWKYKTNKLDIPERLEQSRKLRAVMDRQTKPIILCGDFNLVPDGKSIAMLEEGMRNLITDYKVTSTRSSHYDASKPTRLADYILVSPQVEVKEFTVMLDEVSDHLPLLLDY